MSLSVEHSPKGIPTALSPRVGRSRPGSRASSRPGSRQASPVGRANAQVGLIPLTTRSTSQPRLNYLDGGLAALEAETVDGETLTIKQHSSGQHSPAEELVSGPEGSNGSRTISVRFATADSPRRTASTKPGHGDSSSAAQSPFPSPLVGARRIAQEPKLVTSADELLPDGIAEYTFVQDGVLGKGKFSQVKLAVKNGRKYAIKHTPLYPHHELVATRLLREPTILAQLPPHPNLVQVYESIRTPGHFYLVEQCLDDYLSLETFVAKSAHGKLAPEAAKHVLDQLVSVVRDAIHQPIHVCHRDIKPENVLIHPEKLHVVLLDFGLATHFAASEPKLTTACGSPAFHSPELFTSLRSPPGSVRYRGPEIDAWTIGVTLLRCCLGIKYPLGIGHANIDAMANKTADACLAVEDRALRRILAGLLDMDGDKRVEALLAYEVPEDMRRAAELAMAGRDRDFKSTTFLPAQVKYRLDVRLVSGTDSTPPSPTSPAGNDSPALPAAYKHLRTSTWLDRPAQVAELLLQNPGEEPFARIVSYIKYTLRCAGIVYHCVDDNEQVGPPARPPAPPDSPSQSKDGVQQTPLQPNPSRNRPEGKDEQAKILQCVLQVPKSDVESRAALALKSALRPQLLRARTADPTARSSSTPPTKASRSKGRDEAPRVGCLPFWLAMSQRDGPATLVDHDKATDPRRRSKSKRRRHQLAVVVITISDSRALSAIESAIGSTAGRGEGPAGNASPVNESARTLDVDDQRSMPRGRSDRKAGRPPSALARSASTDAAPRSSNPVLTAVTPSESSGAAGSPQPRTNGRHTDPGGGPQVGGGFFDFAPALMRALKVQSAATPPASAASREHGAEASGATSGGGPKQKLSANDIAGMAAPMF